MSLPRFTLTHRSIILAAIIVAMTLGVVKYLTMPRRADPEYTVRTAIVQTQWPGVEAERVEQLVTFPLEKEILALDDVDVVRSTTWTGLSVIYVDLLDTLDVDKIQEKWEKLRAKVNKVRDRLPEGAGAV